jgi:two-component system, NtrC family, sensor kinase
MKRKGRARTIFILIVAPVLVYLSLVNIADRTSWRTPSDGLNWTQGESGRPKLPPGSFPDFPQITEIHTLSSVDSIPVENLDEHIEILEALSAGTVSDFFVVDYTFRSNKTGEEITVPVKVDNRSQFGKDEIPSVLLAFAFLGIGLFIFLRNWNEHGSFHFAILSFVAFTLLIFRYSGRADTLDIVVYLLSASAFISLPPLFLHFCTYFPRKVFSGIKSWKLLGIIYTLPLIVFLFHMTWFMGRLQAYGFSRTPEISHGLDRFELLVFLLYFTASIAVLARGSRIFWELTERKQLKWLLGGTVFGIVPFAALYAIPFILNMSMDTLNETSVLSLGIIPITFGYAISKYRLRDVDFIFRKSIAYLLASSTLLAFFVGIALLIAKSVQDFSSESSFLLLAVTALAVAVLFAPLKERIDEQIERVIYKDRYGYRRSFLNFGHTLGLEIDLHRLINQIIDRLNKTLDISPIVIYLREKDSANNYALEGSLGLESSDFPPVIELDSSLVLSREIQEDEPETEGWLKLLDSLENCAVNHIEPLTVRGRDIGFLGLGKRSNGEEMSTQDLDMAISMAAYAAVAIDNAALYTSLKTKAVELAHLRIYSENVIESINHGVAVIDPEGMVTVWNNAMAATTDISKADATGQPISALLPGHLTDSVRKLLDGEDWLVSEPHRIFKFHFKTSSENEPKLLNISLAPFFSEEDVNTGTLLVFEDISKRVQLESQLQQAEKLSSIGLFAAGLAHEVNTPLAGISSYAQMLLDDVPENDPKRESLLKIEKQSFRASEIINNLLNFARFSESDFKEVNVNSLMSDTISLLEHQLRKNGISLEMDLAKRLPETLGNGGKLQQVFMNLFLNAKDAMPKGGKLNLRSYQKNSEIVIEINDTGVGISKEDIKKIYDPFFTTKSVGKGTGLGLSVSFGIIQEHSGRISVESQPNKGTSFSLFFPVKRIN